MRKTFLLLMLLSFFAIAQADIVKYNAYEYTTRETNIGWGNSQWHSCNVLILLNTDNGQTTIYSAQPVILDVTQDLINVVFADGSAFESGLYTDQNGTKCYVYSRYPVDSMIDPFLTGQELYIEYSDIVVVYRLRLINPIQ